MSIILDSHRLTERSYLGFLENAIILSLAKAMPDEVFLIPKEKIGTGDWPSNLKAVEFPPLVGLFHQRKTEKWLQAINPSLFISFSRTLRTKQTVKQILIIGNEDCLKELGIGSKVDGVGCTSNYLLSRARKKGDYPQSDLFLTSSLTKVGNLAPDSEDRDIKELFTEGKEYFICTDFFETKDKCIALLKSFSLFKRMQESSWKLMLVMRATDLYSIEDAEKLLSTYKYRADVVITDEADLGKKIGEAYTLISVNEKEIYPVPIVEAILQQTPVIALPTLTNKDIFEDTIVYPVSETNEALADMMMMMYKGETYRKNMFKKMKTISERLKGEDSIMPLQQMIRKLQQEL